MRTVLERNELGSFSGPTVTWKVSERNDKEALRDRGRCFGEEERHIDATAGSCFACIGVEDEFVDSPVIGQDYHDAVGISAFSLRVVEDLPCAVSQCSYLFLLLFIFVLGSNAEVDPKSTRSGSEGILIRLE